jgi:hypothetical protein
MYIRTVNVFDVAEPDISFPVTIVSDVMINKVVPYLNKVAYVIKILSRFRVENITVMIEHKRAKVAIGTPSNGYDFIYKSTDGIWGITDGDTDLELGNCFECGFWEYLTDESDYELDPRHDRQRYVLDIVSYSRDGG